MQNKITLMKNYEKTQPSINHLYFQILASCTKVPVGPSLKDILSANPKLQVVLDKYKDDSLKYKAAVFLIENLPFTIAMKVNL